ncbi:MAG: NERD domain-containing protein [Proteobacteria bacterium]|nr:NERD domain-containing protein [Pseudomonadota bacterium]
MNLGAEFLLTIVVKYWYFIPICIFLLVLKTSFFKGFIGEVIINILSTLCLDKKKYHLIKNVTFPTEDGSTQIDQIIVSEYGIFVVETKNMKGWIFGEEHQKVWTQSIFKHKSKFQNPLHQNYKHVKTLERVLNIESDKFFSVIVFVGDVTFKTKMPANVNYPRGYLNFIKSKNEILLSQEEVKKAIQSIELGRFERSYKTNREHVKHVKKIVHEKQNKKSCSKCGSEMVLRTAKNGANAGEKFWGCSRFPKCRVTIKV